MCGDRYLEIEWHRGFGDRWLEIKGQIGERHHDERHDGERHHGERQHGERHHGERHHGERHHGEGHHGEGHHGEGHQVRRDRTAREHKHKQTHVKTLLGARGQEEGRNCSASMQTSTLEKDKVSGSKSGGQKLGTDAATPGEHKPQNQIVAKR